MVFPRGRAKQYARTPVREKQRIVVSGTVKWSSQGPKIQNPEWEELLRAMAARCKGSPPIPVYPLTQGLNQAQLRRWIGWLLGPPPPAADPLPEAPSGVLGLVPLRVGLLQASINPRSSPTSRAGRRRLAFDELLLVAAGRGASGGRRRRRLLKPRFVLATRLSPRRVRGKLPLP